jgi:hypothetical protein
MSRKLRRFLPVIALSLATMLGGCIIAPGPGYYHGPHWGWGWRR